MAATEVILDRALDVITGGGSSAAAVVDLLRGRYRRVVLRSVAGAVAGNVANIERAATENKMSFEQGPGW